MIISRTPFRISFFGGGTDYPIWYREHGGEVLASAIDKYCYLSCRYLPPFFEHRFRVVYSKIENCQKIDQIQHPAVREVLRYLNFNRGVEIHHDGDLPARSGIGSSSAFTVGLLNSLYHLCGFNAPKEQLITESLLIEQEILKENVGSQDQVMAAHGGFNHLRFSANGEITILPAAVQPNRLSLLKDHLMLFFTGLNRKASDIAGTYLPDLKCKKMELRRLHEQVHEALTLLASDEDLNRFGLLLDEAWKIKSGLSASVCPPEVAQIYDAAKSAGALGGKLTGAGGGGFLLVFVPPFLHNHVRNRLQGLLEIPFQFEYSGSKIIFSDEEQDYSAYEKGRSAQSLWGVYAT